MSDASAVPLTRPAIPSVAQTRDGTASLRVARGLRERESMAGRHPPGARYGRRRSRAFRASRVPVAEAAHGTRGRRPRHPRRQTAGGLVSPQLIRCRIEEVLPDPGAVEPQLLRQCSPLHTTSRPSEPSRWALRPRPWSPTTMWRDFLRLDHRFHVSMVRECSQGKTKISAV